jgi:hypothetical protein
MMQTFDEIEASDVQIERLAAVVERSPTYQQLFYTNACGTPACLIGHHAAINGWLNKVQDGAAWMRAADELGIQYGYEDVNATVIPLFGVHGCNDAGNDGAKAARFLRDWMDGRHWAYAARCRSVP